MTKKCCTVLYRPKPIMLFRLPIMLLSIAPKFSLLCSNYAPLCSIKTWPTDCFIRIYDCSIRVSRSFNLSGRAQQRFRGPSPAFGYATEKETRC